jgi:divinyl protochlorophyllide a 8-vinyl-reductase
MNVQAPDRARIGPNAVIRAAEALDAFEGRAATERLFAAAGIARYLAAPPAAMIAESEVRGLHAAIHRGLGDRRARSVSWIAGRRTADYLLAHRIPQPAQRVIAALPAPLAARLLSTAIARNAWTFAGSGRFSVTAGNPTLFEIADCPLCREAWSATPYCDFYAATFEGLFAALVHADAKAEEVACAAQGDAACRFAVRWPRG